MVDGKATGTKLAVETAAGQPVPRRSLVSALFGLLRPHQWVKNGFVLAPLAFTPPMWNPAAWLQAGLAVVAFCLTSSASYIWNDWRDIESDRQNPKKATRPLAAGEISVPFALTLAVILAALGFGLAAFVDRMVLVVLGGYAALQLFYSTLLKRMVILDVMVISLGFLLRVVAGGAAVDIRLSNWLLLTTSFLALFLGFTKRRQEIKQLGANSHQHRPVLAEYSLQFIDQMNAVLAASCIVCYGLYTVAPETTHKFGENLILTLPFVVYGLLRYLYLIHVRDQGDNPTELVWTDRPLQVCIVLWLVTFLSVIHARPLS